MAGYQSAQAYDFTLFEPKNTNAAPALKPAAEPKRNNVKPNPNLRVIAKNGQVQDTQAKVSNRQVLLILTCCVMMFALIGLFISNSVKTTELMGSISTIENQISNAKSENVRLSSAIDSMFSIANVDAYATDVLGMKKMENYQIRYVDLSTSDQVLYAGEDSAFGGGLLEQIKAYFSQAFA